ncbi:ATP-binding cassette domain-containing protein [Streptosporangium saharense]|uniref:ABC transporter ATP-binding protein n=1 Tax=Streptosporangium saharense TaxID=1706840 RepID=UPI0036C1D424
MTVEPTIAAHDIQVNLGGQAVLRGVDLTAAPGEIVAVIGENGAGKSTLLRCLAGLETPATGRILVLGDPPTDTATFWREVALTGDEPAWYPGLSVQEHLELVTTTHRDNRTDRHPRTNRDGRTDHGELPDHHGQTAPHEQTNRGERANGDQLTNGDRRMDVGAALAAFDLVGRADLHPLTLSTGQRQRVSLATALVRPSRLLLLDEPERGLDTAFRDRLADILREYAVKGGTVVMATHDLGLAESCGARLVRLEAVR